MKFSGSFDSLSIGLIDELYRSSSGISHSGMKLSGRLVAIEPDLRLKILLKNLSSVISNDKLYTIYHGIDVSKIKSSNDTKLKEVIENSKGIVLGNAGRLTTQKGQKYLIDIAKKLVNKNFDDPEEMISILNKLKSNNTKSKFNSIDSSQFLISVLCSRKVLKA